jgi:hypothetical protein
LNRFHISFNQPKDYFEFHTTSDEWIAMFIGTLIISFKLILLFISSSTVFTLSATNSMNNNNLSEIKFDLKQELPPVIQLLLMSTNSGLIDMVDDVLLTLYYGLDVDRYCFPWCVADDTGVGVRLGLELIKCWSRLICVLCNIFVLLEVFQNIADGNNINSSNNIDIDNMKCYIEQIFIDVTLFLDLINRSIKNRNYYDKGLMIVELNNYINNIKYIINNNDLMDIIKNIQIKRNENNINNDNDKVKELLLKMTNMLHSIDSNEYWK